MSDTTLYGTKFQNELNEEYLFSGTKFKYKVPDAFNHENESLQFMLVISNNNNQLHIMYIDNACGCKNGWLKFENISTAEGTIATTKQGLIDFLTRYYTDNDKCLFDKNSLEII